MALTSSSPNHIAGLFGTALACLNVTQGTLQRYASGLRGSGSAAAVHFNGIAPNTQCVQPASAIAQQVQRMSDVHPDQKRKALSGRTRRRVYGTLRFANSSAFSNGLGPHFVSNGWLKLKRRFDSPQDAISKNAEGVAKRNPRRACKIGFVETHTTRALIARQQVGVNPRSELVLELRARARRYFHIDVTLIRDHDRVVGQHVLRLDEAARLRCVPDARLGPQAREADSRAWGSPYP